MNQNINNVFVSEVDMHNSGCPFYRDPTTCTCASCDMARNMKASSEAVNEAYNRSLSGGASNPSIRKQSQSVAPQESMKDKISRQRAERFKESEENWQHLQNNKDRYAKHREKLEEGLGFHLGWYQSPYTQSQSKLWDELFTSSTPKSKQDHIKKCNSHLNDPVRAGEIIIVPTQPPANDKQNQSLSALKTEATAASIELSKLSESEIAAVNRHFELFDHYASCDVTPDKAKEADLYSYASLGVGIASAAIEQHLKNIQGVLLEINSLYAQHIAMASRVGGINYGVFISERSALFEKLDGSFAALSKRSVKIPVYQQVRRNLKLSTRSVIHNADEILKTGFVKNLGKRIANVSIGVSASKGVGWVGVVIGGASAADKVYEACNVDSSGDCTKTSLKAVAGFLGGIFGGSIVASAAVGGVILVMGTASAPVLAIATIGAYVTGSVVGGAGGGKLGEMVVDTVYDASEEVQFIYERIMEEVE